ncbi:arginine/serine-rich coiled-coil protein 2 isoform X2 [Contarinia nasturtii]|uniref:arginine/serine-rich coiled-coil protein 2 isoform X2 n=1 Tax=Contarinia nasturtii TaxID=265458 RepID=UPI0012D49330|nr:arginine/serine-rich coiled-coil protein 2 isoform X2 [Contarinia nasturtii]
MEAIVNYESDDGNGKLKITNESTSKGSMSKKEKRRYSSDDDSSDGSSSPQERSRKVINEDDSKSSSRYSPSPRKSSSKTSRNDKHKTHENRSDRNRSRSRSSSRDRHDRKKKNGDRDDRKKYRNRSRDRERRRERSDSLDREDRHQDRSSERRKDRYDDHKRHNKARENERRYEDKRDYSQRRDESSHRNNSRSSSDARTSASSSSSSSNSSSAIRRAEALNRQIERRANEKVQQLQKLGIEIPTLMQQHQQLQLKAQNQQQNSHIKPLMSISTSGPTNLKLNPNATSTDETTTEGEKNLALNLSNFTSSVLTNARYTEQMQKKKLIWGAKKAAEPSTTNNKWEAAKFSQDNDGKVASKFLRLMGMKNVPSTAAANDADSGVEKREEMFSSMEQQYEVARQATHTMRGVGLGFGSHSRPC